MTLGGYGIDLTECCLCGRPYTGRGRAVFERRKGGIACLRCGKEGRHSPGLDPDTVKGLNIIQTAPWPEVKALSLSDDIIREIRAALRLHTGYRMGRRLKSAEYLD